MFNQYARVLASIPRWSVVPVLRRQYVAEHSYYVSLYVAELLALPIFDHWHEERKYATLRYALIHDVEEARMSDIPGPVKRMIKDPAKLEATEAKVRGGMGYTDRHGFQWSIDPEAKKVVKAADLIDEFFYLNMEASLGSRIVTRLLEQVEARLMAALEALPWDSQPGYTARWLFSEISEQAAQLDAGIETLSNNDDVNPSPGGVCDDPNCRGCSKCDIPY